MYQTKQSLLNGKLSNADPGHYLDGWQKAGPVSKLRPVCLIGNKLNNTEPGHSLDGWPLRIIGYW